MFCTWCLLYQLSFEYKEFFYPAFFYHYSRGQAQGLFLLLFEQKNFCKRLFPYNAQCKCTILRRDVARKQCKPTGSWGRNRKRRTPGFSPPYSLLPFCVSAITVLSKVRLGKNKPANLSTQISFISYGWGYSADDGLLSVFLMSRDVMENHQTAVRSQSEL